VRGTFLQKVMSEMERKDYVYERKYKYIPLNFLLRELDSLVIELQEKDANGDKKFREEFTKLKGLVDEVTLRLA
jgi:hypothetical protein